jgi:CRP-like cAMP-binding protein
MMHQPGDTRVFPKFTKEQLAVLSPYGTEQEYAEGEYLFTENDIVDSFYVVLEGRFLSRVRERTRRSRPTRPASSPGSS